MLTSEVCITSPLSVARALEQHLSTEAVFQNRWKRKLVDDWLIQDHLENDKEMERFVL